MFSSFVFIGLTGFWLIQGQVSSTADGQEVTDITNIRARFLVYVGEPFNHCNATAATEYIKVGQNWTDAPTINVSSCDNGKFMYKIQEDAKTKILTVFINYDTKAYMIGPPPSCTFKWKGDYQNPISHNMELSPLPGCDYQFTNKENQTSYFIFQMLMWQWFE